MAGLFAVTSCTPTEKSNSKEINGEGLAAHEVKKARQDFHVDGSGVKVCVISNSIRYLGQTAGITKQDVTSLPGQDGIQKDNKDNGEGTAMLEIVHSIAPGAELMFAAASHDAEQMAHNIKVLAKDKCRIIVDDIEFFNQSPFQDDEIAQAVNKVTAQGVLYITAAGNEGNTRSGSSGVWEGNFRAGKVLSDGATLHVFEPGDQNGEFNMILGDCGRDEKVSVDAYLFWNDPVPQIGCCKDPADLSDYKIWAYDSNGVLQEKDNDSNEKPREVKDTAPHTSGDTPYRHIHFYAPNRTDSNRTWIVIAKAAGKADRFLHLAIKVEPHGCRLQYRTEGAISGHAGAVSAITVASKSAHERDSRLGEDGSFLGGPQEHVNFTSSEGPRLMFFTPGGDSYIRPRLLKKPDVTAADGVTTDVPVPSLKRFFGTSAAAPQVAGIAALMWSKNPHLTAEQIKEALLSSAIQIEGNESWNSRSGYGIVNAVRALRAIEPLTAEASSSQCCRDGAGSLK